MLFGGFQKTTLVDYPGKIASILFVLGCSFRCGFCYNPELVFSKAKGIPEEKILSELEARKKLVDAVVVTGGEPTIYSDLPAFLGKLKSRGFFVKLDSNGSNPAMLAEVFGKKLADYVAMDVKAPWKKYSQVCGVNADADAIRKSADLIKKSGVEYEFRCTAAPMLSEDDLLETAKQVSPAKRFFFQAFQANVPLLDKTLEGKKGVPFARLEKIASSLKGFGKCEAR